MKLTLNTKKKIGTYYFTPTCLELLQLFASTLGMDYKDEDDSHYPSASIGDSNESDYLVLTFNTRLEGWSMGYWKQDKVRFNESIDDLSIREVKQMIIDFSLYYKDIKMKNKLKEIKKDFK